MHKNDDEWQMDADKYEIEMRRALEAASPYIDHICRTEGEDHAQHVVQALSDMKENSAVS